MLSLGVIASALRYAFCSALALASYGGPIHMSQALLYIDKQEWSGRHFIPLSCDVGILHSLQELASIFLPLIHHLYSC